MLKLKAIKRRQRANLHLLLIKGVNTDFYPNSTALELLQISKLNSLKTNIFDLKMEFT